MQTTIVTILCAAPLIVFIIYCSRKDRRVARERRAVEIALSPGPKVREMTTARSKPLKVRHLANGSQPTFTPLTPNDFSHVPTNYGTYTPADVDVAILERADTELHHVDSVCAEAPSHQTFGSGHHDGCSTHDSTHDSSYGGGFDTGGHHGE